MCQRIDPGLCVLYITYMDGDSPEVRRCARTGAAHADQGIVALLLVSAEEAARLALAPAGTSARSGPSWLCAACYADLCMNASSRTTSEIVNTIDNVFVPAAVA